MKIYLTFLLLLAVGFLAPSGVMAQLVKGGGSNNPTPGTTHGHGGSGHTGPYIAKPGVGASGALQMSIVVKLLQAASQAWGIPFSDLFSAYLKGELTIDEISPGIFRVTYDGTTIDLILEDL